MYTLFAYPNSYAMTTHAVLEEIGAPYEVHWVQIFSDEVDADFAAASPHYSSTPAQEAVNKINIYIINYSKHSQHDKRIVKFIEALWRFIFYTVFAVLGN